MITITLEEPAALETLSVLKLESAKAVIEASYEVEMGRDRSAKLASLRGERLNAIAMAVQTALLLQRGLDRAANEG